MLILSVHRLPVVILLLVPVSGGSVAVLVANCAQTCVSVASGPALSDQLSTADSTRSSDDDLEPGLPCSPSAVHIHFQSAAAAPRSTLSSVSLCLKHNAVTFREIRRLAVMLRYWHHHVGASVFSFPGGKLNVSDQNHFYPKWSTDWLFLFYQFFC